MRLRFGVLALIGLVLAIASFVLAPDSGAHRHAERTGPVKPDAYTAANARADGNPCPDEHAAGHTGRAAHQHAASANPRAHDNACADAHAQTYGDTEATHGHAHTRPLGWRRESAAAHPDADA